MVTLLQPKSGRTFQVTSVYGPTLEAHKQGFIDELRALQGFISHPWFLVGDFNVVRWLIDCSNLARDFGLMFSFNDLIRNLQLMDVPLLNHSYTYSNKQLALSLSRLDRCFLTSNLVASFPDIKLKALEVIVSDHVPMILSCKQMRPTKSLMRIERFWL